MAPGAGPGRRGGTHRSRGHTGESGDRAGRGGGRGRAEPRPRPLRGGRGGDGARHQPGGDEGDPGAGGDGSDPGRRGAAGRNHGVRLLGGLQRSGRVGGPEPDPSGRYAHLQPLPPRWGVLRVQRGHGGTGRVARGRVSGGVRRTGVFGADHRVGCGRRRNQRGRRRESAGDARGRGRVAPRWRRRCARPRQHPLARLRTPLVLRRAAQALDRIPVSSDRHAGCLRGVDEGRQPHPGLHLYRP